MREGCGGDGEGDVKIISLGSLCDIQEGCLYHRECDRGFLYSLHLVFGEVLLLFIGILKRL